MKRSGHSHLQAAFTVVELIIVVAVISILAAVALVSYNGVQKSSRDTQREADVAAIMDALEDYYEENGEYPANDTLNPTNSPTQLPNFTAVKTALPGLDSEALVGPGGYKFYAACKEGACSNTSANWQTYMTKSYWYLSRYSGDAADSSNTKSVEPSFGNGTGWGCEVTTDYDDPGYVIAWYSEAEKVWVFKKSRHGKVDIASYGGGPIAPQVCMLG